MIVTSQTMKWLALKSSSCPDHACKTCSFLDAQIFPPRFIIEITLLAIFNAKKKNRTYSNVDVNQKSYNMPIRMVEMTILN